MIQEQVFTKKECEWILSFTEIENWSDRENTVLEYIPDWGGDAIKVNVPTNRSYCSEILYKKDDNRVSKLVDFLLSKLNHLGILNINVINFIKYETGSFMARHRDTGGGYDTETTLKSVTIQLSDGSDYSGGDLIVDGITADKSIGNVVIFDSQRFHEITKVESGTRISLVLFLERGSFFEKNKKII